MLLIVLFYRLQQQDKHQHSDIQVVPSHPTYYPVIHSPVIDSFYHQQSPAMDRFYKQKSYMDFGAYHDTYSKSTMYAPAKSQTIAVGRES